MTTEEEALIAAASSAWRPASPTGALKFHPAWHDLSAAGRRRAFEETVKLRAMEAAIDPEGLTTTARAVLARIPKP